MDRERKKSAQFAALRRARHSMSDVALRETLSAPSDAWREYLRQEPDARFTASKTLDLAKKMSKGGDRKARFCAASAYSDLALLDRYGYHGYLTEAKQHFTYCFNHSESARESLTSAVRLYTLPLYRLPHTANKLTDAELEKQLETVRNSLNAIITITAEALVGEDPFGEKGSILRGMITEAGILCALQRPEIIRSGYVAIPAAPWEESSIKSDSLFIPINSEMSRNRPIQPIKKNRNYNISVISIEDPNVRIPIQVRTSGKRSYYDDSILVVSGDVIAKEICEAQNIPFQKFDSLISMCTQDERSERLSAVSDFLIDDVLKIS